MTLGLDGVVKGDGEQNPGGGLVEVGGIHFGGGEFHFLAGPCAVESREQLLTIARAVGEMGAAVLRGGAYKPRSSPYSFQGLKEEGLDLLLQAREVSGLPIVTEVVSVAHVEQVAAFADLLQVGARNMQNFELLRRLGQINKPVLLKRGLAATIEEWLSAAQYIAAEGNTRIILCERGIRTYESATRFTLDLSAVPLAKSLSGYPVIVDPSHSTGRAELVVPMAKAAVAVGADGLLVEVHNSPEDALCDGKQSLELEAFGRMVKELAPFINAAGRSLRKPGKRSGLGSCKQISGGNKYYPSAEQFLTRARNGEKVIPVYTEIMLDNETPVTALMKLGQTPYSFILESVEGSEQIARYSFVGNDPYLVFQTEGDSIKIGTAENGEAFPNKEFIWKERKGVRPLDELQRLLGRYTARGEQNLPRFFGGAVGYMGFNGVGYFEPVLKKGCTPEAGIADVNLLFTRSVLIFDHLKGTLKVVVNTLPGDDPQQAHSRARRLIHSILGRLKKSVSLPGVEAGAGSQELNAGSNFSREEFCAAVEKAKEYINSGDIFQVVLSQRFSLPANFDPLKLLRCLKTVNPSPYMFYLSLGELALVGASPEMLVRLEEDEVSLRPIAGTRRRGKDAEEDRALSRQLVNDEKEQAEHVMLVDLGRNDLGRICRFGTVTVEEFAKVEYFSHVMHLVSRVKGKVLPGVTPLAVLAAAFPAGTVSGAPKIRAIEIINQLEKGPRGPYAGMVGYISYHGQMDTCINIRSVTIHRGQAHVQTGAGIVADSQPDKEYEETLNKARAMLQAIVMARGVRGNDGTGD